MKRLEVIVAAVLVVSTLAVCTAAPRVEQPDQEESLALWTHKETLEDLVGAADIVIRGRAVRKVQEIQTSAHAGRPPFYVTETLVDVNRTLKGTVSGTIRVVQFGRENDPANNFPELPILQPNWNVLLFLTDVTANPLYTDGQVRYEIIGPEALYEVVGGGLKTRVLKLPVGKEAANSTVEAFERRITALASSR